MSPFGVSLPDPQLDFDVEVAVECRYCGLRWRVEAQANPQAGLGAFEDECPRCGEAGILEVGDVV